MAQEHVHRPARILPLVLTSVAALCTVALVWAQIAVRFELTLLFVTAMGFAGTLIMGWSLLLTPKVLRVTPDGLWIGGQGAEWSGVWLGPLSSRTGKWGIRANEFIITFRDADTGEQGEYAVNSNMYRGWAELYAQIESNLRP